MELNPKHTVESFVKPLARRAQHVGANTLYFAGGVIGVFGRPTFEAVSHRLDEDLATDELAIEALHKAVSPDMEGFQWKTVALIKARRLLTHIELDEEDVQSRLADLDQIFREQSEHCSLDSLPLDFEQKETLRIKLKEVEPEHK